ncbi:rod shape-determining protein RodA [Yinghuangia sp. ASG 101]|uniref:rod shape-determining protein RodA n=1 Tax=Yinghuangia sp. ASG 101 TaxID=2896848 RepID=UPI001E52794A|nr:rod shape-determining protein RodA [Yinghuangia sp. ASG 101]UGQ09778.1 rod shape-determining protein RodA [Yinghuangia sp. ASG 101]
MNIGLKMRQTKPKAFGLGGPPTLQKLSPGNDREPRSFAARALERDAPVRRLDWVLFGASLALSVIGSLLVWSATRPRTHLTGGDPQAFLKKHLLNMVIGLVLFAIVAMVGHRRMRVLVPFVGIVAMLGLFAALSPLGATINGQRAWILLPAGFSLQPAELAKIGVILGMAMLLSERVDTGDLERPGNRAVFWAVLLAMAPIGVIMLMPDLGSAMVIGVIIMGILLASGARIRWLVGLATLAVVVALAVWKLGMVSEYQIDRFRAFADPDLDPAGAGYNVKQAGLAVGAGGLTGAGLFQGNQTQGQFVPEQQTDFVFSVAGEELGLIGCAVILFLFAALLWRGVRIAVNADDLFGTIIAAGVVAWLGFQMFENIGMNIGIMPVAGLPLPFVSYGGSSMFAIWIAIGLLQSVHMRGAKALTKA